MNSPTWRIAPMILFSLPLMLSACGGGPDRPEVKPTAEPAANPLAAALARKAAGGRLPEDAVITLAIFLSDAAPDDPAKGAEALKQEVFAAFKKPPAAWAGAGVSGQPPELSLAPLPVERLPLNLDPLVESAGPLGESIRQARSVIFVRYTGPVTAQDAHLKATAMAAGVLAEARGAAVTDFSTLKTWPATAWREGLQRADWVAGQIRITGELEETGTVRLRTRGLAKLGAPDLEQSGVTREQAEAALKAFAEQVGAVQKQRAVKPGEALGGAALTECSGPAEGYDHRCVALPPLKGGS